MDKKDIIEIINIAEIAEENGHHELHDELIKISARDYGIENAKITDPWQRQVQPTDFIQAITKSFLKPATKSAVIEALKTQKGQQILRYLNIALPNMLKGKAEKYPYIPGYATDAGRLTGPATASDPYKGYESWMTPGTPSERLQDLSNEKQGYTELIQKFIQRLGDEGIMRMVGTP